MNGGHFIDLNDEPFPSSNNVLGKVRVIKKLTEKVYESKSVKHP